jgi:hypothetical protein
MKNTEIRIGNYVHYQINDKMDERKQWNEVTRIDPIDFECFDKYYLPIHLTESWLYELGFNNKLDTKKFNKQKLWFIDNLDFEFRLRQSVNGYYNLFMFDIYFQKESPTKYNIFYVHQLQNLYFALTEKELEVKL